MKTTDAPSAPSIDAAAPQLAPWEFAGLLVTYWCNARCEFCYTCSGPDRDALMEVPAALALWRSLDRLAASHGKEMRVHLAGGEPFRDWVRLVSIIRAARDAGLTPLEKLETNAFWATDDGLTRARLELLDALGMGMLVISADVYHQQFVPTGRVRRCVETARRVLGPGRVQVRWWDFYHASCQRSAQTQSLDAAERDHAFREALARHHDRLTGRAALRLARLLPAQSPEAFRGLNCVKEILRSRHVHIDPYGNVFPGICCGIILGCAAASSVEDVGRDFAANWRRNPAIEALVTGGSYELLQRARSLGYQEDSRGYASKCHLCADVRQHLVDCGLWPEFLGPRECYAPASEHSG